MNRGYCTTPDGGARRLLSLKIPGGIGYALGMIMASKNRFKCNEVLSAMINRPLCGADGSLPDEKAGEGGAG